VVRGIPADCKGSGRSEAARPRPTEDEHEENALAASVVACAQTNLQWEQTAAVVRPVLHQHPGSAVVLLAAHEHYEIADGLALEKDGAPGLSDTHDAGFCAAAQPIEAFLEYDAKARQGCLASHVEGCGHPDVVAANATHIRLGCSVEPSGAVGLGRPRRQPDQHRLDPADPSGNRIPGLPRFSGTGGQRTTRLRRARVFHPAQSELTGIASPISGHSESRIAGPGRRRM
jgi:hypothetical protein